MLGIIGNMKTNVIKVDPTFSNSIFILLELK
jgi:hypothetical protein